MLTLDDGLQRIHINIFVIDRGLIGVPMLRNKGEIEFFNIFPFFATLYFSEVASLKFYTERFLVRIRTCLATLEIYKFNFWALIGLV